MRKLPYYAMYAFMWVAQKFGVKFFGSGD